MCATGGLIWTIWPCRRLESSVSLCVCECTLVFICKLTIDKVKSGEKCFSLCPYCLFFFLAKGNLKVMSNVISLLSLPDLFTFLQTSTCSQCFVFVCIIYFICKISNRKSCFHCLNIIHKNIYICWLVALTYCIIWGCVIVRLLANIPINTYWHWGSLLSPAVSFILFFSTLSVSSWALYQY